jgi:hypothetical protein
MQLIRVTFLAERPEGKECLDNSVNKTRLRFPHPLIPVIEMSSMKVFSVNETRRTMGRTTRVLDAKVNAVVAVKSPRTAKNLAALAGLP